MDISELSTEDMDAILEKLLTTQNQKNPNIIALNRTLASGKSLTYKHLSV
jgi:hypothetical protein